MFRHQAPTAPKLAAKAKATTIALILAAATIATVTSCKKSSTNPNNNTSITGPMDSTLIGTWTWVQSYNNGIASGAYTGNPLGDTTTPASTGIQQTLTLTANSTYSITQNNQTVEQGTYKMSILLSPEGAIDMLDLMQNGQPDNILNHVISHDTLTLSQAHVTSVDRNYVYVRTSGVSQPNNP